MASKKKVTVSKTIDGVKVEVDPRRFHDMRFIRTLAQVWRLDAKREKAAKKGDAEAEGGFIIDELDLLDSIGEIIFGKDNQKVQDRVAAKNDGILTMEAWYSFISALIEEFSQKNPNAHPAP